MNKPVKKSDVELWWLISEMILIGAYVFVKHAQDRLYQRQISDLDVINILENKAMSRRKRNKEKDVYLTGYTDWSYCVEGYDIDNCKIRIIISFTADKLLIITAMHIETQEPL